VAARESAPLLAGRTTTWGRLYSPKDLSHLLTYRVTVGSRRGWTLISRIKTLKQRIQEDPGASA